MNNLGIYYPTHSFWHGLDPRCKFLIVLFLMVISWMVTGIGWFGLLGIVLFMFLSARLPLRLPLELLWKLKWLLVITFVANLFFPIVSNNLWMSLNHNLVQAAVVFGRLTVMLLVATWLSWVTRPMLLVEGVNRLLKPLARFKAPIIDISLIMTLVLRFIPELLMESETIMVAQQVRGVRPQLTWKGSRTWMQSTIIPLFISSIRKSVTMAVAMEARGFRPGAPRSSMEELKFQAADYVVFGLIGIVIVLWMVKRLA